MAREKSHIPLLEALQGLGLSGSEAAVYWYLLQHSPATGYRVAQAIAKPVANTYKTIASLEQKGAVVVDDSGTRLCRAVPAEEFLARLENQFKTRRARAMSAVTDLTRTSSKTRGQADPRVYQLKS